jgi:hypothetical protein
MLAAAAVSAFLAAFGGTWSCTVDSPRTAAGAVSRMTIAAEPSGPWTRITIAPRGPGAIAYVGYLRHDRTWIAEWFHDDGSFSSRVSSGPVDGVWVWHGTSTTAGSMRHDSVEWRRDGATIRRRYGRSMGADFFTSSSDVCRR